MKVASPVKKFGVTSKLWPSEYGEGKTMEGIDKMLERLDIGYIDLLLLHQQVGDYMGDWKDMEKALKQGKVKTIGLKKWSRLGQWIKMCVSLRFRLSSRKHSLLRGRRKIK